MISQLQDFDFNSATGTFDSGQQAHPVHFCHDRALRQVSTLSGVRTRGCQLWEVFTSSG
jgi:hypothetical protein